MAYRILYLLSAPSALNKSSFDSVILLSRFLLFVQNPCTTLIRFFFYSKGKLKQIHFARIGYSIIHFVSSRATTQIHMYVQ